MPFPKRLSRAFIPFPRLRQWKALSTAGAYAPLPLQFLRVQRTTGIRYSRAKKIIAQIRELNLSPALPATDDLYEIYGDLLTQVLARCNLEDGKPAYKLDRLAVTRDLILSTVRKRVKMGKRLSVDIDWRKQIDHEFKDTPAPKGSLEDHGRHEKATALRELSAARFSVLIGAAGTGKTTLLKFLCDATPINQHGVLLLAPTGKARVRLQQATGMQAHTIAQFLRPMRYDDATQRYRVVATSSGRPPTRL